MRSRQTPHHVARKLKKTLLFTICGGVLALCLLVLSITVVTNNLSSELVKTEQTALSGVSKTLKDQQAFALPDQTSNIPTQLDDKTLVKVIAKNQPAVVRILTVYCADITLQSGNATLSEKDACSAGVGSGSIISSDGYLATNGHVVAASPKQALLSTFTSNEEIKQYLDYLVVAKLVPTATATSILTAVKNGTTGATDRLDATVNLIPSATISSSDVNVYYAVQLGNEPVRINKIGNRLAVAFTDTIMRATLVDQDFDQETVDASLQSGQFTSSDVALLKMNGSFPYVHLGGSDRVRVGDQLTAIGFPAFIDDSVNTEQWQTVPSITQGKVAEITTDSALGGRKIFNTSVPISQGSSGGPSFNDQGDQIGLNTYITLQCEDQQCFGDGQVRDVEDLKTLLAKNDITLKTGGVTDDWYRGLDAYVSGKYAEALNSFEKVQAAYPPNYLVSSFSRLARQQIGSSSDTSASFQAKEVTTILIMIVGGILVVIVATVTILISYYTRKHHRETPVAIEPVQPPVNQ